MTIPEIRAFRVVSREQSSGQSKITSGIRTSVPNAYVQARAAQLLDEAARRRSYTDWHRRFRRLQEQHPGRSRDWLLARMHDQAHR